MFYFTDSGADVPLSSDAVQPQREPVRHLLFGSLAAVQLNIKTLHKKATPNPTTGANLLPPGDRVR